MEHNVARASDHLLPVLQAAPSATGKLLTAWAVRSMRPLFVAVLLLGVLVLGGCAVDRRASHLEYEVWNFKQDAGDWNTRLQAYLAKQQAHNQRAARWRSGLTNTQADLLALVQIRQNDETRKQFGQALTPAQGDEAYALLLEESNLAVERAKLVEAARILEQRRAGVMEGFARLQRQREADRASLQGTLNLLNTLNQIQTSRQLDQIERNTRR